MACCDWLVATGALTAQCVGINKTAVCKLIQRDDVTFTLSVRPQETGRHMLTIKFNNEHVPGKLLLPTTYYRLHHGPENVAVIDCNYSCLILIDFNNSALL